MGAKTIAAVGLAGAAAARHWRRHPSACPYAQRWAIEVPRPFITPERLLEVLAPTPGERLLELGPGTGYYSLEVAAALGHGTLELFDIQEEMLDHTVQKGAERGLANLVPTQGDGSTLPYADDRFDGAFLVTVLGEIPDQGAALGEIARVVRPGGRVVFGETMFDPHVVMPATLRRRAAEAGMRFGSQRGNVLGYFARFSV
jgi:ubiquinone/menaquinone biosynthesis C-methylase UbiE